MFGVGTNVYGIIFTTIAIIAGIWSFRLINKQHIKNIAVRISSYFAIGCTYIILVVIFWNLLQSITTNSSNYQSSAEIAEHKKVQETPTMSQKEIADKRNQQKYIQDVKPQEDALNSYDEAMKKEAEKIKQRSN